MEKYKQDNFNSKDKKLSGAELAKKELEKELGIPYSEFEMLDLDEQHKLIE